MNDNQSNPSLTVYRASAGSGKTFTLAQQYIKMLVHNPEAYRGILAVTFTNKATEEMKMRILSNLYGLWKGLPESRKFMDALLEKLHEEGSNYSEEEVARNAGKALNSMLHNYHFFRVQTIDTFFQSVLRNLARELQLNAGLRVELKNEEVIDEAVDELIDTLADDAAMRAVVMGFIRENLENGEAWNIIGGIKKFSENLFKEFYKENRKQLDEKLSKPEFFDAYKRKLYAMLRQCEGKYRAIGAEALRMLEENGLTVKDFKSGASGVMGYFVKLNNGRFMESNIVGKNVANAMESIEGWVAKSGKGASRDVALHLAEERLLPLLLSAEKERGHDAMMCKSAKATLAHLNDLRLLANVESMVRNLNEDSQRFMLSDTQGLLNDMIKDDDSPFVFEKIGAHLEHIMIDEFQDTSRIQWANFKKLLRECMSQGHSNLIVGDVKQSIYRFRNSDWRLLNNIGVVSDDDEPLPGKICFKKMDTNYRSWRNVIKFNNLFFEKAREIVEQEMAVDSKGYADQFSHAYEDVEQESDAKEPKGMVHICLASPKSEKSMEERTLEIVRQLLDRGVAQRDIAVLAKQKAHVVSIAASLEDNGINVVSAEAFRLGASKMVRVIVCAMKVLARPADVISLAQLKKDAEMDELPEDFTNRKEYLLTLSLHDLAEEIVRLFSLQGQEGAYVTAFFDCLRAFTDEFTAVLEDFLAEWDNSICDQKIETPDCDGVRLLTIHKSKGLEYDHVILPYCNWELEDSRHGNIIWCNPSVAPMNELPVVPIVYKSDLKDTIYKNDWVEEHMQSIVDNLNVLYVAMTRAGKSLFVIGGGKKSGNNRSVLIRQVIDKLASDHTEEWEGVRVQVDIPEAEDEDVTLSYGQLEDSYAKEKCDEEAEVKKKTEDSAGAVVRTSFLSKPAAIHVDVTSMGNKVTFRQSNASRTFADDSLDDADRQRYCRMGTVLHNIFSEIKTLDDIPHVLQRMEFDGALYGEGMTKAQLVCELKKRFALPRVKAWFDDHWTVFNECSIITKDGEQRPDRVMTDGRETIVVDFKFGQPHAEHIEQVQRYEKLLETMDMPGVKGFLWYVSLNRVVEVKMNEPTTK